MHHPIDTPSSPPAADEPPGDHEQERLDESLEETFPASDPIASGRFT